MMTNTENKALRFSTEAEAKEWLRATGNYGMVHDVFVSGIGAHYIIVQFHDGGAWAFSAADNLVNLPHW